MTKDIIQKLIEVKEGELNELRKELLNKEIEDSPYKIGDVFICKKGYLHLRIIKSIKIDDNMEVSYLLSTISVSSANCDLLVATLPMTFTLSEINEGFVKIGTGTIALSDNIQELNINYKL